MSTSAPDDNISRVSKESPDRVRCNNWILELRKTLYFYKHVDSAFEGNRISIPQRKGKEVRTEVKKAGDKRMEENERRDLERLVAQMEDPRMERTTRHRVQESIMRALCGVICGAEGWVEIEAFGKPQDAFLAHGSICSMVFRLTIRVRVCAPINPKHCEASAVPWVQVIRNTVIGVSDR